MKYVIVIGDGMADNPVPELSGKTPLEYADIPAMDALARRAQAGSVRTVPVGVAPGSDTAILSIFGYDPRRYYSGRSPLEAAGSGVKLETGDISYRCNMVTLEDSDAPYLQKRILSHSGGSIDGASAIALMQYLLEDPAFAACAQKYNTTFYLNPSFRHIAVQKGADITGLAAAAPHEHLDEEIGPHLPKGCDTAAGLCEMMRLAHELLNDHPINRQRRAEGKLPANGIWFWAEGSAIGLPNFAEKYHKKGFAVSAVPLVHGIAALAGFDVRMVEGATGELDTNYEGKTEAVLAGLAEGYDIAVLHVEAPDECTHNGDTPGKLQAIEWLDSRCVRLLVAMLDKLAQPYRILILSDHKTLTSTRGHDADPVPYLLYDSTKNTAGVPHYTESCCAKGGFIEEGHTLVGRLLQE